MNVRLAAIGLVALISACGPSTGQTPASPSPSSNPSPTLPAGFVCTQVTGGAVTDSTVTTVTVEQSSGFDRFVIEFGGGVTTYSVTPQSSATFTRSPKGDQVTLEGTSGVLITLHSVTNWTSYAGPTALTPRYPHLRQAMQVENFEGYQQWALGVEGAACVRVTVLGSPSRLAVDLAGA